MLDYLANSLHSVCCCICYLVYNNNICVYTHIYIHMQFSVCVFVYKFHIWIDRA